MERPLRLLLLADVVLPLPLAETYTYRLPESLRGRVEVGSRLIVPFRTTKVYSAVVVRVREDVSPENYQLKDAIDLLDDAPILLPDQLCLWQWIANYYICSMGEVYKAALPSGLKLESESVVVYNPDYDADTPLTRTEQHIVDLLEHLREQRIFELQKAVEVKNILPVIKSLLEKGAVVMREELKRTYRPKTVHCIRLTEAFFSENRLNQLFEDLGRAQKQKDLLLRYLDLSKASAALTLQNRSLLVELEKQSLIEGFSEAAFKGLRDRGVLEVYEKQISRLESNSSSFALSWLYLSPQNAIFISNEDFSTIGAAASYQSLNQPQKAIEYYKKALNINPNNKEIPYYLAVLYSDIKDWQNSKTYINKALALNTNKFCSEDNLSQILMSQEKSKEAYGQVKRN